MSPGFATPPPEVALDLALAVISSSDAPLLLLDGGLAIVAASRSFCRAFQLNPAHVTGQRLADLGAGEWDVPQLDALLQSTASGFAEVQGYEMELKRVDRTARRLLINAHKLVYADGRETRLLLSASDVTDARVSQRQKEDLLREKAILLQELQHRVANSLQIIASVLMQSARRMQSDEARAQLHGSGEPLASIASLQQQLAASQLGDVPLRPYFTELCRSLGASMIRDRARLSLVATVDDSVVDSSTSISLGLIVTELVINALKHAFPGQRSGEIKVDYHSNGTNWVLSVSDDGVGMPAEAEHAKAGLGTSIVTAIAGQLQAVIGLASANPGTTVSIEHDQSATEDDSRAPPPMLAPA